MADRKGHGQNRKAEGQSHTAKAIPKLGKSRRQHCTAASPEYQHKGAEKFGA